MDYFKELYLMQQAYATLFALANKLQVQGDKYLKPLTARQLMAMVAIFHLPEDETTLNNVARMLGTTKQSVKQLITILESKGYLIAVPSPKDKRAVNLKVTEAGRKACQSCSAQSLNFFGDLFQDFTTEEIETLWNLLKKLYQFDGEMQDGFEAMASVEIEEQELNEQIEALKEFEARRKLHKSKQK